MEDVYARVHIFAAMALHSAVFTPGKAPVLRVEYRRLNGPQDQSVHEGVKKNLHTPPTPGIEPGPPSP